MGPLMHLTGGPRHSNALQSLDGCQQVPAAGGDHRDRCSPMQSSTHSCRSPCSDSGSVSTYPPRPLAPSNGTTTVRRHKDDRRSAAEWDTAAPRGRDGSAADAGGTSAQLEARTSALSASGDAPARQHRSVSLDRFLEQPFSGHEAERARAACVANEAQARSRGLRRRDGWPPAIVQDTEVADQRLEGSAVAGRADGRVGRDTASAGATRRSERQEATRERGRTAPSRRGAAGLRS
jgi:hypothetical protein